MRGISMPHQESSPGQVGALGVVEVRDVARLKPNPLNRDLRGDLSRDDPGIKELAASILQSKGPMEPLLILPDGTIVAGERRWLACQVAGISRVRVIVRRLSQQEQLEAMLVENGQRESLTAIGQARGCQRLIDMGLSQADIRRRTGFPTPHIANHLALLKQPETVQKLISSRRLAMGCIKIL